MLSPSGPFQDADSRQYQNSYVARKHLFFSVFRSLQDKPAWSFLISLSNTSHWGGENKTSSTSFQMSCDFFRAFAFCEILKLELLDATSSNSRASHIERQGRHTSRARARYCHVILFVLCLLYLFCAAFQLFCSFQFRCFHFHIHSNF